MYRRTSRFLTRYSIHPMRMMKKGITNSDHLREVIFGSAFSGSYFYDSEFFNF